MPEGPEVARISESLNRHLSGKYLIKMGVSESSRYYSRGGFPGMNHITFGLKVIMVWARGKKIVFRFESLDGRTFYAVSFLGMEGHWIQYYSKHTALTFEFGDIWKVGGTYLYNTTTPFFYEDTRRFGTFELFDNEEDLQKAFKAIGPDLLHDQITFEHYWSVIMQKKLINKQVVWFLLEQKFFSGIGNYLKSEVLYLSRLSPSRLIGSLTPEEVQRLYLTSLQVIRLAYQHNGLTLSSYVDPDGNQGTYVPNVYNKMLDPSGNQVIKETFTDKRSTFWVPAIQV